MELICSQYPLLKDLMAACPAQAGSLLMVYKDITLGKSADGSAKGSVLTYCKVKNGSMCEYWSSKGLGGAPLSATRSLR
jgi:hypothetical protein